MSMVSVSVRARLLPLIPALFLSSCGEKTAEPDTAVGIKDLQTSYGGLAFAVTDSTYTSSTLMYYDFKTAAIATILAGQSGDPYLKWLNNRLYVFNRTGSSLNFVTVDPRTTAVTPSPQLSTPGAGRGDPHDVLALSDGRLLLAQWTKGALVVMDQATGAASQTLDATGLDLSGNTQAQFHPQALWSRVVDGIEQVYVLHQSRAANFAAAEGTQQLFVYTYAQKTLTPVDTDAAASGIQGIKLHVSNADLIRAQDDKTLFIAGFCSVWDPASSCTQSGIDRIDLTTQKVDFVVDLSASAHRGNGSVIWGGGDVYYAEAAVASSDGAIEEAYVLKIDAQSQTVDKVHTFPAGSSGCCGLFADSTSGRFYVGDTTTDGRGQLSIYPQPGATPTIVALSGAPYQGALVPK